MDQILVEGASWPDKDRKTPVLEGKRAVSEE